MTAALSASDTTSLTHSRDYCRVLTKKAARNFYYGLKLMPEPKRSAMYALYAYMRLVDDIADDTSNGRTVDQRRADLDQWQQHTHAALAGAPSKSHILWPAFADLVHTYNIPAQLFDDMIEGQRQDLVPAPFAKFADLQQYCYRVASVVGLASIHVWGEVRSTGFSLPASGEAAATPSGHRTLDTGHSSEPSTHQLAIDRGIAFQLTNILRDFREDTIRGRVYFPAEDFVRFHINPATLSPKSSELATFLKFQVDRAESYYQSSAPLAARISTDSRPTLDAMTNIYHAILKKIALKPTRILAKRIRLSPFTKLLLAWRAMRSK